VTLLRPRYLLPLLFLVGFSVRTPTLGLPLEGRGALLAATVAEGDLLVAGTAPLVPALARAATGFGVSPTAALRGLDAVLAACLAPLLYLVALGLGVSRGRAAWAALILAIHPLALAGSGGVAAGTEAAGVAFTLASIACLSQGRVGAIRAGAVLALLAAVSDGGALLGVPALLWLYARRESGPRFQTAVLLLGLAVIAAAHFTWFSWGQAALPGPSRTLLWLLSATLGVLLVPLPGGLSRLARLGAPALAWIAAVVIPALAALAGAPVHASGLLPLIALAGVEGMSGWSARRRAWLQPAVAGGALAASLWLVLGGLQAALLPDAPAAAGRLHLLQRAMQVAAEAAGPRGWIVLAVGSGRPEEQASLADLQPGRWTWAERASEADATARRRLLVFPAGSFESGGTVAVVAPQGRTGGVQTFDGAGIFQEEVVREVGPYVVLRARRP